MKSNLENYYDDHNINTENIHPREYWLFDKLNDDTTLLVDALDAQQTELRIANKYVDGFDLRARLKIAAMIGVTLGGILGMCLIFKNGEMEQLQNRLTTRDNQLAHLQNESLLARENMHFEIEVEELRKAQSEFWWKASLVAVSGFGMGVLFLSMSFKIQGK